MAGSSRRRSSSPIRSAIRGGGARRGRSTAPADLPPPPPPQRHYRGVRQREWGTWVAENTNGNTGRRIWLGTFQSARQTAWAHDVENVRLHGSACGELNFPLGCDDEVPKLSPLPSRGRAARVAREDREAWERLEAEAAGEAYMEELRRLNPERVVAEARKYEEYAAKRHAASSSSAAAPSSSSAAAPSSVVIDLDGDSHSNLSVERWLDSLYD